MSSEHLRAERLGRQGVARQADDGELAGEQLARCQVVERRDQLALGQVAGRAEDDHDARVGGLPLTGCVALTRLAADMCLRFLSAQPPDGRSTCPPNLLRIADSTFSAKVLSCRDRKRVKSETASTSTGTASSIAV